MLYYKKMKLFLLYRIVQAMQQHVSLIMNNIHILIFIEMDLKNLDLKLIVYIDMICINWDVILEKCNG